MFLFPLGLKAKSRRFPIASVLIVVATTIYSLLHLEDTDRVANALAQSPLAASLVPARIALTFASCARGKFSDEDCAYLKETFDAQMPQDPARFSVFMREKLEARFRSVPREKARELEDMLFSDKYWVEKQVESAALPGYQAFREALAAFQREQSELQSQQHFFSAGNFNVRSLFEAMFRHDGWLFLVSHMVVFLFIAVAVEERVGSLAFVVLYLLGGAAGNTLQVFMNRDEWQILLGAASNVAAIAGLHLALFWRLRMRVWVSFFFYRKVLQVPVMAFVPFLIAAVDFIALAIGGFEGARLAPLAQFGGLVVGAIGGLLWSRLRPVRPAAVFPFEDQLLDRARNSEDALVRLPLLAEVLYHHCDNREAIEIALVAVLQEAATPWEMLEKPTRRFIKRNFHLIFADRLRSLHESEFVEFVAALPKDWPLEKIVHSIDFDRLKAVVAYCQSQRRFDVAARILRVLCEMTEGKLREQLERYLTSIEKEIASAIDERTSA